jgi:phytoene dehydrogenase-like protein
VFERRPVVGGAAVTEALWPGFRISRASYVSSFRPEIARELELSRFGFSDGPIDPQVVVPFPDGRSLVVHESNAKTARSVEAFSTRDARAFERLAEEAERFAETLEPVWLAPPPSLPDLVGFVGGGPEVEETLRRFLLTSVKDLLNETFESPEVKAALCMQGVLNTSMGPSTVGTSYILALSLGRGGYRYAIGGTGAISQALARCATHHGARIRTSAEVRAVTTSRGRATGIELASGERVRAAAVVSNADPKRTFLRLLGPEALEPAFRERVERLRAPGTSLKVNLALGAALSLSSLSDRPKDDPARRAPVDIAPSVEYIERAFDECKWGRPPKEPPLDLFSQSAWDPTVAPPGEHTLSIIAKYNPYHLASGDWDSLRAEALDRALAVLERYAPGVRASVRHVEALTPLDLERTFGLTEGNVTHLDQTLDQMLSFRPLPGWARYRTPVQGLYLAGAGTHPGGGVTGAPGHNAAAALLEDWPRLRAAG